MLSKNQLGFLYMFLSICAFSLMDLIVKWSVDYPIGKVLFFRGFFGIIFYFFIIPKERFHNFYRTQSETARNNFNVFYGEEEYTYRMNRFLKEVINE